MKKKLPIGYYYCIGIFIILFFVLFKFYNNSILVSLIGSIIFAPILTIIGTIFVLFIKSIYGDDKND